MKRLGVQYLEGGTGFVPPTVDEVLAQLRDTFARLPVDDLLIGWDVPPDVAHVCREECERAGAQLYQWHPLLVGWGEVTVRPAWQVLDDRGQPIAGFRGLPEFTFMRPDHPDVQEAVLRRLEASLECGLYDGIFLDRIRYPVVAPRHADLAPNVTALVTQAAALIRAHGGRVGLDCFAPSLALQVGQDLGALAEVSDWIKVMIYGHTWAPAGLPYELGLQEGLSPQALAAEFRLGRELCPGELLAGIELVSLPDVTRLSPGQIRADLAALRQAGADGLVLSWDLRYMPSSYLALVRDALADSE